MALQRTAFLTAVFLLAQSPQDVSGFSANPLATQRRFVHQSTTAISAEPSASEKAAELRQKAEKAKRKAQELKKVAEAKAEAAMEAVKRANDKNKRREPVAAAAVDPSPPASKPKASSRIFGADPADGAIIAINQETVEFTSGILGGALALALGANLPFAVAAAAAANYISKKDGLGEVNQLIQAVSTASLGTVNWFGKLDSKYTILGKLTDSLDKSLDELKNGEGASAQTVKTIEETTKKIQQLADEIDLIEGGKQALGAVGDVLETSIDKAFDVNKEFKLTERAAGAAKKAIDNAKD